jgi:hypothetical protein
MKMYLSLLLLEDGFITSITDISGRNLCHLLSQILPSRKVFLLSKIIRTVGLYIPNTRRISDLTTDVHMIAMLVSSTQMQTYSLQ